MTAQENQDLMSESENSATPSQDDSQQAFMEKETQLHTSLSLQQEVGASSLLGLLWVRMGQCMKGENKVLLRLL